MEAHRNSLIQDETVDSSIGGRMSNIIEVFQAGKKIVFDKLRLLCIEQQEMKEQTNSAVINIVKTFESTKLCN